MIHATWTHEAQDSRFRTEARKVCLAQLGEHPPRKGKVGGSSPPADNLGKADTSKLDAVEYVLVTTDRASQVWWVW